MIFPVVEIQPCHVMIVLKKFIIIRILQESMIVKKRAYGMFVKRYIVM